jgi:uncharacterized protein with PIN domain
MARPVGLFMSPIYFNERTRCPHCSSRSVRRSRRRGKIERIVSAVFRVSPYRCEECDYRYFRWRSAHESRVLRGA